jgi:hypothetical protein
MFRFFCITIGDPVIELNFICDESIIDSDLSRNKTAPLCNQRILKRI